MTACSLTWIHLSFFILFLAYFILWTAKGHRNVRKLDYFTITVLKSWKLIHLQILCEENDILPSPLGFFSRFLVMIVAYTEKTEPAQDKQEAVTWINNNLCCSFSQAVQIPAPNQTESASPTGTCGYVFILMSQTHTHTYQDRLTLNRQTDCFRPTEMLEDNLKINQTMFGHTCV